MVLSAAKGGRQAPIMAIEFSAKDQNRDPATYPASRDCELLGMNGNDFALDSYLHEVSLKNVA